jgi:3-hydroxybutyryl-CoA dehydrogenase
MRLDEMNFGVIGAGLMGHGIAQVFAVAGARVRVFDPDPQALRSLRQRIETNLELVGGGDGAVELISPVDSLADAAEGADMVIEAAPEDLGLKQRIFEDLDAATGEETVLATNTSVMSVGEIAECATGTSRIVGTHWWNPPYLVPLVEVVETQETSDETVNTTITILEAAGKSPVHVRRDIPGFVGNRLQHAMWREAFALIDAGVCDPSTVDRVVRDGFGSRLAVIGPVENADLVGLDLIESIHQYVLPHLDCSSGPAEGLASRVGRGELGAKSGRGYLDWPEGGAERTRERLTKHLLAAAAGPDRQRDEGPVTTTATSGGGET